MKISDFILKGILKSKSNRITKLQKFLDPFILVNVFFIIFNDGKIIFNFLYLGIFFINLVILNSQNIYKSYREIKLIKIIPTLLFISCLIAISSILISRPNFNDIYQDLIIFLLFTFSYLLLHHFFIRLFLRFARSKGYNFRNAIFFGNKKSYEKIKLKFKNYPWLGYRIVYWFSPNEIDQNQSKTKNNCRGGILDLMKTINKNDFDKLFFCLDDSDQISFEEVLKGLGDSCIPVSFIPTWDANLLSLKKEYFGDIVALNIWNPSYAQINQQIKRIFDLSLSLLLMILFFPILIVIAGLIKLTSKGPIFFVQNRYGLKGRKFSMYKFRTMFFEENSNDKKIVQAKINDIRITKIGRFLRKYSLDELPQLINVIKGEMSLVGPRPHAIQHNEHYRKLILGYMQRHSKLPGMTGLAQVNGARGETKDLDFMKMRINYDLEYNNNWSLLKDLEILFNSIFEVIRGNGY